MKATLAFIKKVADEIATQGSSSILLDAMSPISETTLAYKMAIGLGR